MAIARIYNGRSGLKFRCDDCDTWIAVGYDRLERNPSFECYQCGATITVPNPQPLVNAGRTAQAAMQAVHEEMDACPVFNSLEMFGEAELMKVTWD